MHASCESPFLEKVGRAVIFHYKNETFSVQEYQDVVEIGKYRWICTSKDSGKVIFNNFCRSTAQCIKLVKEMLDRQ